MGRHSEECNCDQALALKQVVKVQQDYIDGLHDHVVALAEEKNQLNVAWLNLMNYVKRWEKKL